jgi:hypothetical protein
LRHVNDAGGQLCLNGCPLAEVMKEGKPREAHVYQVSRSLLTQEVPAADDWATITRTYADISDHAVVLLNAAADQGVIKGEEFQVLAPQLQAVHDGWAGR